MKKEFFDIMLTLMRENKDIYLIFAGLGWPRITEFLTEFPDRAINTEASEQTASDICTGLAYAGKIPVMYTITPFYYRCFETIRTYWNHESLHVIMIGAGRDEDYSQHDGYSHDAKDIRMIFNTQDNITQYYPETKKELQDTLQVVVKLSNPAFISVPR